MTLEMITTDEWRAQIARKTGVAPERVAEVLSDSAIPGRVSLPPRPRMRIEAVHFAGIKDRRAADDARIDEPFSFTHVFDSPTTAFVTRARNDAGKSTVLEVILWAIRGRSHIAADVRAWTRQIAVELTIGDSRLLVAWHMEDGIPNGCILRLNETRPVWEHENRVALSAMQDEAEGRQPEHGLPGNTVQRLIEDLVKHQATVIAQFATERELRDEVEEFMGTALGFRTVPVWTRNRHATDAADGHVSTHGWALWSQALSIYGDPIKVTLGETTQAVPAMLDVYLGTAWGPSASAARAKASEKSSAIETLRRRQRADKAAQTAAVDELEQELQAAIAQLAGLPEQTWEAFDQNVSEALNAASSLGDAEVALLTAAAEYGQLQRDLEGARADEAALVEAAVTRRFWHSLKPDCCPRCDTKIGAARWKRELEGECSLCHSDFDNSAITVDEPAPVGSDQGEDDTQDDLQVARDRITALQVAVTAASDRHDAALSMRNTARDTREQTSFSQTDAMAAKRRRELELQVAVLNGRLDERRRANVPDAQLVEREGEIAVLQAAELVARKYRDLERDDLLRHVSERVTELGRALGFTELDKATFKANANLPVVKGGVQEKFSNLTHGEKLRLKIALVMALFRVGHDADVVRHPGIIVIDSVAREEMNHADLRILLAELQRVSEELGLQVIVSSADGVTVQSALPEGAVRFARPTDDYMW